MDRVQFGSVGLSLRYVCVVIDGIWEQQCEWHVRGDDICSRLLPSMSCLTHPLITRTEPTAASQIHSTDACDSHYQVSEICNNRLCLHPHTYSFYTFLSLSHYVSCLQTCKWSHISKIHASSVHSCLLSQYSSCHGTT